MKLPSLKTVLLTPLIIFAVLYSVAAIVLSMRDLPAISHVHSPDSPLEIAIFGASGTAGDGILKAALASSDIGNIKVITRRVTPRIQSGVDAGKVDLTLHQDYTDYGALRNEIANIDAVYWAIGISSIGVDEQTYGEIHVDFPVQFLREWGEVSQIKKPSFHFISSSDISEESTTMWVRQKIRAEKALFELGRVKGLRVVAYRPDYIGPTEEEAHIGQDLLYWFFKPVGAAIRATQIGNAMIDLTLRGDSIANGSKFNNLKISLHAKSYVNGANFNP